jgi:hypothetical protein
MVEKAPQQHSESRYPEVKSCELRAKREDATNGVRAAYFSTFDGRLSTILKTAVPVVRQWSANKHSD